MRKIHKNGLKKATFTSCRAQKWTETYRNEYQAANVRCCSRAHSIAAYAICHSLFIFHISLSVSISGSRWKWIQRLSASFLRITHTRVDTKKNACVRVNGVESKSVFRRSYWRRLQFPLIGLLLTSLSILDRPKMLKVLVLPLKNVAFIHVECNCKFESDHELFIVRIVIRSMIVTRMKYGISTGFAMKHDLRIHHWKCTWNFNIVYWKKNCMCECKCVLCPYTVNSIQHDTIIFIII